VDTHTYKVTDTTDYPCIGYHRNVVGFNIDRLLEDFFRRKNKR